MYRDACRDENGGHRHSYWQRRAVLAAGLCVVGLLAWAVIAHGKPTNPAPRNLQASGTLQGLTGRSASVSPSAPADGTEPSGQPGCVAARAAEARRACRRLRYRGSVSFSKMSV